MNTSQPIDELPIVVESEIHDAVPEPVAVMPEVEPEPTSSIRMYKTTKGNRIDISTLAEDARIDIDAVRIIDIPAQVKQYRIRRNSYEAPTLAESGGGRNTTCQVIAGKDGRPVTSTDVYRINTDPSRLGDQYATVSVGIGNYFAVGWLMKSDLVILVYEIVAMSEHVNHKNREQKFPIAKLTSRLVAHEISSWRHNSISIPDFLAPLVAATRNRLRNDAAFPFYVDMFRLVRPDATMKAHVDAILAANETEQYHMANQECITQLMQEILDIRYYQYLNLSPVQRKQWIEPVKLIETLTLDPNGNFVDLSITPIRDDAVPATFRLRLTHHNFIDENGAMLVERSLVLNNTSFDRLMLELEGRNEITTIAHLNSLR